MRGALQIALMCIGVSMILASVGAADVFGIILGVGLIVAPFTASAVFVHGALAAGIPLSLALLAAYAAAHIFGKDTAVILLGLIIGGVVGLKIVFSDAFDRLSDGLRGISNKDREPQ